MLRRKLKSVKFSGIIMAVLILLIFLHYIGLLAPFENVIVRVLSPLQSLVFRGGKTLNTVYDPTTKIVANQTPEQLQALVTQLHIENQRLKNIIEQQESVLSQMDFLQNHGMNSIFSRVVGLDTISKKNIIVIDKGSKDGIQKNYPVIVEDGIFIGKVIDVETEFSRVLLVTDQLSQVATTFGSNEGTYGIVTGDTMFTMRMDLIPKETEVFINDIVVTSGVEPNIPKGLIVGTVFRIEDESNEFFQTAFINPIHNVNTISFVSVLLPKIQILNVENE